MKDIEGAAYALPIPRHSSEKLDLSSGRCRIARRNYSSLQTPNFRVNSRMKLNKVTVDPIRVWVVIPMFFFWVKLMKQQFFVYYSALC